MLRRIGSGMPVAARLALGWLRAVTWQGRARCCSTGLSAVSAAVAAASSSSSTTPPSRIDQVPSETAPRAPIYRPAAPNSRHLIELARARAPVAVLVERIQHTLWSGSTVDSGLACTLLSEYSHVRHFSSVQKLYTALVQLGVPLSEQADRLVVDALRLNRDYAGCVQFCETLFRSGRGRTFSARISNAYMQSLVALQRVSEALEYLRRTQDARPAAVDTGSFNIVLEAVCVRGDMALAGAVLALMRAHGHPPDAHTAAILVRGWLAAGHRSRAALELDGLREPHDLLAAGTPLLEAHLTAGDLAAADALLARWAACGVRPDSTASAVLARGWAAADQPDRALAALRRVRQSQRGEAVHAVQRALCRQGNVAVAVQLGLAERLSWAQWARLLRDCMADADAAAGAGGAAGPAARAAARAPTTPVGAADAGDGAAVPACVARAQALLDALAAQQPLSRGLIASFAAAAARHAGVAGVHAALQYARARPVGATYHVLDDALAVLAERAGPAAAQQVCDEAARAGTALSVHSFRPVVLAYARRGDVPAALAQLQRMLAAWVVPDRALLAALMELAPAQREPLLQLARACGLVAGRAPDGLHSPLPLFGLPGALAEAVLLEALTTAAAAATRPPAKAAAAAADAAVDSGGGAATPLPAPIAPPPPPPLVAVRALDPYGSVYTDAEVRAALSVTPPHRVPAVLAAAMRENFAPLQRVFATLTGLELPVTLEQALAGHPVTLIRSDQWEYVLSSHRRSSASVV